MTENRGSPPASASKHVSDYLGPFGPADSPADCNFVSEASALGVKPAEELPGQSTESLEIINHCFKLISLRVVMQQMIADTSPKNVLFA